MVESSHLGVNRTLDKLEVAHPTFYRWYARYQTRGEAGLNNHYRVPVRFTHAQGYFVSESTVYRLLKSYELITSPAFVVIKASNLAIPFINGNKDPAIHMNKIPKKGLCKFADTFIDDKIS